MVVGFNHNFRYKGEVYHVQTEDGGLKNPQIITLLYKGGTILGSKKTSYADIVQKDNLEQVVEEMMKEQHKGMLFRLKGGEFDAAIEQGKGGSSVSSPEVEETEELLVGAESLESSADLSPSPSPCNDQSASERAPSPAPLPQDESLESEDKHDKETDKEPAKPNLDDIIFSYLTGDS